MTKKKTKAKVTRELNIQLEFSNEPIFIEEEKINYDNMLGDYDLEQYEDD